MNFLLLFKMVLLILFCGFLTIGFSMDQHMLNELGDKHKIIYGAINSAGKSLSAKHRMRQMGNGVGAMDKLWLASLDFENHDLLMTEQEARCLIVSCVNEFIEALNNSRELRPFLKVYPFTAENIELAVYNCGSAQQDAIHPFISIVSMSRGKITYFTRNKDKPIRFESEKYETFAEAVAILAKETLMKNDGNHTECSASAPEQPSTR